MAEPLKQPKTYQEQINNLVDNHGLIISDRTVAEEILSTVNYYRLSAYGIGLKQAADKELYQPGITIENLYHLYQFDSQLRNILTPLVEYVEIKFRTKVAYHLALTYGSEGYRDAGNFNTKTDANGISIHQKTIDQLDSEIRHQKNLPCVIHHQTKYGGHFPVWAAMELFSFGMVCSLYSVCSNQDKKKISSKFKMNPQHLYSWMLSLLELRNMCAHYNRLYNMFFNMGSSGMGEKLSKFAKDNYPDSKSDLFAVFMERITPMLASNGYQAMITQHAWMFLSSFEKLRGKLQKIDTVNMAHLGARAFEEIGGEVVQTTSFVLRNSRIPDYKGTYCRLIEPATQQGKEELFFSNEDRYIAQQEKFNKLPGSPVAYWASSQLIHAYDNSLLKEIGEARQGLATTDNNTYLRLWYEVDLQRIGFNCRNKQEALTTKRKWFPFNKGGEYRKWFGNNYYVINWENDGYDLKGLIAKRYGNASKRIANEELYFIECITWSAVAASKPSFRYSPAGSLFDIGANGAFFKEHDQILYILGLLNATVVEKLIQITNPTINTGNGVIGNLPVCINHACKRQIVELVQACIETSHTDWDSFETSWDFQFHPLMPVYSNHPGEDGYRLADFYAGWEHRCEERFLQLKTNEEELNRIFIDIYGLQDELTPDVDDKDVTVRKADKKRDIKSLISFAIGCMLGRYQVGSTGLKFAGGDWKAYAAEHWPNPDTMLFAPDKDGILPITEDEYFDDDIVAYFVRFVSVVYGRQTLEENLQFIADALGETGTPRQIIRQYFPERFLQGSLRYVFRDRQRQASHLLAVRQRQEERLQGTGLHASLAAGHHCPCAHGLRP